MYFGGPGWFGWACTQPRTASPANARTLICSTYSNHEADNHALEARAAHPLLWRPPLTQYDNLAPIFWSLLLTSAAGKATPHPLSSTGKMPKLEAPTNASASPAQGEVSLRSELSLRFRYRAPSADETDQIDSGGAALVF